MTQPPSHNGAYASVSSSILTQYEPQGGYIASDDLILRWGGFSEPAQTPLTYEVHVIDSGTTQQWNGVGFVTMLTVSELQLAENAVHSIEVRAVNSAGEPSQPVTRTFVIVTTPPYDTGE